MLAQDELTDIATNGTDHADGITIDKAYVCGFLIHRRGYNDDWVALIRKARPAWQAGKLNGIGGSIEPDETALFAMQREFKEETGATIDDWRCFAVLKHGRALVYMFVSFCEYTELQQTTDEKVEWFHISITRTPTVISNLSWLIPLAVSGNKEVAMICDDAPLPVPQS